METTQILEMLDDLAAGHDDTGVAMAAMHAAERIRELRDQLMEQEVDRNNAPVTVADA